MSWVDELAASPLSARSMWRDIRADWRSYSEAGVPLANRFSFLGLRLVQRVAYRAGWLAGVRAKRRRPELRHAKATHAWPPVADQTSKDVESVS